MSSGCLPGGGACGVGECVGEESAGSGYSALHSSTWAAEDRCGIVITVTNHCDQNKRLTESERESDDGVAEFGRNDRVVGATGCCASKGEAFDPGRFTSQAVRVVETDAASDREQP